MKTLKILIATIISVALFVSCEDNSIPDSEKSLVQLVLKASNVTTKEATVGNVTIEKFLINIDEIEFDLDDDSNQSFDDDDISIDGPFLVDLMSPDAFDGITLPTSMIPNARYDEIEMDIDNSRNASVPEINNRSVYISGTIGQTPFEMWYDDDFDFEIELDDSQMVELSGESLRVLIEFRIPVLLQSLVNNGLGNALDRNNNGIIEIWEDDPDGNDNIADNIIDAIEDSLDVDSDDDYDDDYDDDDDDDDDK